MIIFFYGEDSFRSNKALNNLKSKFVKEIDPQKNALIQIDAEKSEFKDLWEKISNKSLFSEKKMIIIENLFKNKKTSIFEKMLDKLEFLEKENKDTIVFYESGKEKISGKKNNIFFTKLAKQKFSQEFKILSKEGKLIFIKNELDQYNKEITNSAAKYLLDSFANDSWALSNELKKAAFSIDKSIIELKDVKQISKEIFSEDIFILTDAIGTKNKKKSLELIEKQRAAGLSDDFLLSMLIRHFKILIQVKSEINNKSNTNKFTSKLKLHPFVIKKSTIQVSRFNGQELKNIYNKLIEIDFKNKKGLNSLSNQIFYLISSL